MERTTNRQVAQVLRQTADVLEQQRASPYRIAAYRRAAGTVAGLDEDVGGLLEQGGAKALESLPDVGRGIAATIEEILASGRSSRLERLRGALDPEHLFQTVPGIGPEFARRIHEVLHVDTLEALEVAAHDGSLQRVPGVGPRRAEAVRAALASILGRMRVRRRSGSAAPPVEVLLDVDREYREKADADRLHRIAPRRFNPEGRAWLPILHTTRGRWHFTALYSNTALAHKLGRTRDWVVLFHDDDHHAEGQHTVVTESRGQLEGRRVVRGREAECRALHAARHETAS